MHNINTKMKYIYLGLIILFLTTYSFARRLPETVLRVGIFQNAKSFNLSCEGGYYLYELNSGERSEIKPLDDYLVKGDGAKIQFGGKVFSSPVRIISEKSENRLRIDGRRYHDNVIIRSKNSKLTVINEIGIEDYLCGILPREVSPAWDIESLKAQAIVSRTYALKNLRRHESESFDLCTQTHCQVYGGIESEDERTNEAVKSTLGEVLVFEGELAQTLFHASCGGHTENPENVWSWESRAPKYLLGRKDAFCQDSPHNLWKNRLANSLIKERLNKSGYRVGNISKITLEGKSRSGRAKIIKIKNSGGTLTISAAKFRLAVDPWLIKSTMFTALLRYRDGYEFRGKGWGHGVGLCQWGAKIMAEKNYKYNEILHYFYPGTQVEKWDE